MFKACAVALLATSGFASSLKSKIQSEQIAYNDFQRDQGIWGSWLPYTSAPAGFYLCGGAIKNEPAQGSGDDTATNGLKFKYCNSANWNDQREIVATEGYWGSWTGYTMCPTGGIVVGMQTKVEDQQGNGDDTAFNGLRIFCATSNGSVQRLEIGSAPFGSWKTPFFWGTGLNAVAVKLEGQQGSGDDTALNAIAPKATSVGLRVTGCASGTMVNSCTMSCPNLDGGQYGWVCLYTTTSTTQGCCYRNESLV